MDIQDNDDFSNTLKQYYSFKEIYYNEIKRLTKQIKDEKTPLQDKIDKFQKIKPKCVNCGRKVGMVFSEKNRNLKMSCGSKEEPCELNVHLFVGKKEYVDDLIDNMQDLIKEQKEKIIKLKLDLVYNYKEQEEVTEEFSKIKKDYVELQKLNDSLLLKKEKYLNKDEVNATNKKILTEINELINMINVKIENYKSTNELQHIVDIINLYSEQVIEKYTALNKNKYKQMFIMRQSDEFYLIQNEYNKKDMFMSLFNDEKSKIINKG